MNLGRTSVLTTCCCLFLFNCRKDPAVLPGDPVAADCAEFIHPQHIDTDTISMLNEDFSAGRNITFEIQDGPGLVLRADRTHYFMQGMDMLSIMVELEGVSDDSTGVFEKPWVAMYHPRSFEVGDTLSPWADLLEAAPLYFQVQGEAYSPLPPPVFYIGFVRIINGEKHVGYVRIGTSLNFGQLKFWIESVKLASCPGMPIIISG